MKKFIAAGAVMLMLLTGCGSAIEGGADEPGVNSVDSDTNSGYGDGNLIPDNEYYVKKIDLNGTVCIIFRDGQAGSISCDWETPATPTDDGVIQ